ncbi:MAG: hypothetical protein HYZ24_17405 [Chloroflexi bacterium]|jgi:hypothetical protein|nr:hypothetical protein [Chloroflexota bacterium]
MKKIFLTTLLLLTALLSACATTPAASDSQDTPGDATAVAELVTQGLTAAAPVATNKPAETTSVQLTSDYENAVSVEMQLALGMMNLEGTANAITKEQAAALLPLWTLFSTLSQSMMPDMSSMGQGQAGGTPQPPTVDEDAQKQLAELTEQIRSALTVEQIQAIADMKITQESAQTIMQELGLEMNAPQGGGAPSDAGGQGGQQPPSGDQGMGMPPTDGGQMRGGGVIRPQLLEALIKYLETKSAS